MTASVVPNSEAHHRLTRSRRRPGLSRLQHIACALGMVLGVSSASVAVPLIQSGLAGFQTERVLNAWNEKADLPPAHLWDQLLQRAEGSVSTFPALSGEYLDRLGRVQAWGALIEPENAEHWQRAAASFRASTQVRPAWPWSWLRLAHAKLQAGERDAEFDHAWQEAARLGHGRLELNRDLARIGFDSWRLLTIEQRALALQAAERVVARNEQHAKDMQRVAQAAGVGPALCWSVDASIQTRHHICKEEG